MDIQQDSERDNLVPEEILDTNQRFEASDVPSQAEGEAMPESEEEPLALSEAQAKAEEYYKHLQRLQAEFDNFRKRTQKEKEHLIHYASEQLITDLLPVLDNLERALASVGQLREPDAVVQGVEMIYKQIHKILEDQGVTVIAAEGQIFDPLLHEAVLQEESAQEANWILQELQKGYRLKDKVIRYSQVKVSC